MDDVFEIVPEKLRRIQMEIRYKKELYSKNVLFKTCYKFTDVAYVHLDSDSNDFIVTISPKNNDDITDFDREFANQMIEETNREIVNEQTKNIRQILFARSMASTVIYDEQIGEIETDVTDKSAMKDWFSNE